MRVSIDRTLGAFRRWQTLSSALRDEAARLVAAHGHERVAIELTSDAHIVIDAVPAGPNPRPPELPARTFLVLLSPSRQGPDYWVYSSPPIPSRSVRHDRGAISYVDVTHLLDQWLTTVDSDQGRERLAIDKRLISFSFVRVFDRPFTQADVEAADRLERALKSALKLEDRNVYSDAVKPGNPLIQIAFGEPSRLPAETDSPPVFLAGVNAGHSGDHQPYHLLTRPRTTHFALGEPKAVSLDVATGLFEGWLAAVRRNPPGKLRTSGGIDPPSALPRRAEGIDDLGSRAIDARFEGVETYIERALADETRPLDPGVEEQLQGYLQMMRGWHHAGGNDTVMYERIMAGIARLLPGLFATDVLPQAAPVDEAHHVVEATTRLLSTVESLGDEDEDAEREHLDDEVLPALEAAADALTSMADAVDPDSHPGAGGEVGEGILPRVGEWVDTKIERVETGLSPWGQRLERISTDIRSAWLRLPVKMQAGLMFGTVKTLDWIAAVLSKAWPG